MGYSNPRNPGKLQRLRIMWTLVLYLWPQRRRVTLRALIWQASPHPSIEHQIVGDKVRRILIGDFT